METVVKPNDVLSHMEFFNSKLRVLKHLEDDTSRHIVLLRTDISDTTVDRDFVNIALALKYFGYRVSIITTTFSEEFCHEDIKQFPITKVGTWIPRNICGFFRYLMMINRSAYAAFWIRKNQAKINPTLIVCNSNVVAIPILKLFGSVRVVHYQYIKEIIQHYASSGIRKSVNRMYSWAVSYANEIIVYNEQCQDLFKQYFPLVTVPVSILYPCVNAGSFRNKQTRSVTNSLRDVTTNGHVFIAIGNFEPQSEFIFVIDVFCKLLASLQEKDRFVSNICLVLAGNYDSTKRAQKEYYNYICRYINQTIYGNFITLLTSLTMDMRKTILKAATAIINATPSEIINRIVLEALYCGTPILSVNSGVPTELILNRITGYLLPPVVERFSEILYFLVCEPIITMYMHYMCMLDFANRFGFTTYATCLEEFIFNNIQSENSRVWTNIPLKIHMRRLLKIFLVLRLNKFHLRGKVDIKEVLEFQHCYELRHAAYLGLLNYFNAEEDITPDYLDCEIFEDFDFDNPFHYLIANIELQTKFLRYAYPESCLEGNLEALVSSNLVQHLIRHRIQEELFKMLIEAHDNLSFLKNQLQRVIIDQDGEPIHIIIQWFLFSSAQIAELISEQQNEFENNIDINSATSEHTEANESPVDTEINIFEAVDYTVVKIIERSEHSGVKTCEISIQTDDQSTRNAETERRTVTTQTAYQLKNETMNQMEKQQKEDVSVQTEINTENVNKNTRTTNNKQSGNDKSVDKSSLESEAKEHENLSLDDFFDDKSFFESNEKQNDNAMTNKFALKEVSDSMSPREMAADASTVSSSNSETQTEKRNTRWRINIDLDENSDNAIIPDSKSITANSMSGKLAIGENVANYNINISVNDVPKTECDAIDSKEILQEKDLALHTEDPDTLGKEIFLINAEEKAKPEILPENKEVLEKDVKKEDIQEEDNAPKYLQATQNTQLVTDAEVQPAIVQVPETVTVQEEINGSTEIIDKTSDVDLVSKPIVKTVPYEVDFDKDPGASDNRKNFLSEQKTSQEDAEEPSEKFNEKPAISSEEKCLSGAVKVAKKLSEEKLSMSTVKNDECAADTRLYLESINSNSGTKFTKIPDENVNENLPKSNDNTSKEVAKLDQKPNAVIETTNKSPTPELLEKLHEKNEKGAVTCSKKITPRRVLPFRKVKTETNSFETAKTYSYETVDSTKKLNIMTETYCYTPDQEQDLIHENEFTEEMKEEKEAPNAESEKPNEDKNSKADETRAVSTVKKSTYQKQIFVKEKFLPEEKKHISEEKHTLEERKDLMLATVSSTTLINDLSEINSFNVSKIPKAKSAPGSYKSTPSTMTRIPIKIGSKSMAALLKKRRDFESAEKTTDRSTSEIEKILVETNKDNLETSEQLNDSSRISNSLFDDISGIEPLQNLSSSEPTNKMNVSECDPEFGSSKRDSSPYPSMHYIPRPNKNMTLLQEFELSDSSSSGEISPGNLSPKKIEFPIPASTLCLEKVRMSLQEAIAKKKAENKADEMKNLLSQPEDEIPIATVFTEHADQSKEEKLESTKQPIKDNITEVETKQNLIRKRRRFVKSPVKHTRTSAARMKLGQEIKSRPNSAGLLEKTQVVVKMRRECTSPGFPVKQKESTRSNSTESKASRGYYKKPATYLERETQHKDVKRLKHLTDSTKPQESTNENTVGVKPPHSRGCRTYAALYKKNLTQSKKTEAAFEDKNVSEFAAKNNSSK